MSPLLHPVTSDGLILVCTLSVSRSYIAPSGRGAPPKSQALRAIVDTGASDSAIDERLIPWLGTPTHDSVNIRTPGSSGSVPRLRYVVALELPLPAGPVRFEPWVVIATPLSYLPAQVLLGRDVLNYLYLGYADPNGQFWLEDYLGLAGAGPVAWSP